MASIINATTSSGVAVSGDTSGVLQLATNGGTTAVTIDTAQKVGIGTTSPVSKLNVIDSTNNCALYFGYSSGGGTNYYQSNANQYFTNYGGSAQQACINAYGIGVGTANPSSGIGIAFPATQVASSDANTLDDYEEGTFTPTLTGGTNPTVNYNYQAGWYTKIGNLVHFRLQCYTNSYTGGSGTLFISGLPFTLNSSYGGTFSLASSRVDYNPGCVMATGGADGNSTKIYLSETNDNTTDSVIALSSWNSGAVAGVSISGFYIV